MSLVTTIVNDIIKIGTTKGDPYSVPATEQDYGSHIQEELLKDAYRKNAIDRNRNKRDRERVMQIVAISGMGLVLYLAFKD